MSWQTVIRARLQEHALRAGRDTIDRVAGRLHVLSPKVPERATELLEPLFIAIADVGRELSATRQAAGERLDVLAAASSKASRRSALIDIVSEVSKVSKVSEVSSGLAQDLRAIDRWLDASAIRDRGLFQVHVAEQSWEFLALVCAAELDDIAEQQGKQLSEEFSTELDALVVHVESMVREPQLRWPTRVAACKLMGGFAAVFPRYQALARQALLDHVAVPDLDPWVQVAALEVYTKERARLGEPLEGLLAPIASPDADARAHLGHDHFLVRARAARLCGQHGLWKILARVITGPEPSEHVRIETARALGGAGKRYPFELLQALLRAQEVGPAVVRAAAYVSVLPTDERGINFQNKFQNKFQNEIRDEEWAGLVADGLSPDEDPWVVGIVIGAIDARRAAIASSSSTSGRAVCHEAWSRPLQHWARTANGDLAESASLLLKWLRIQQNESQRQALSALQTWLGTARDGSSSVFADGPVADLSPSDLLETMAVAAADGFDVSADIEGGHRSGYRLHCGSQPRFASWRLVHELLSPAPDKRQGHDHTVDRLPLGSLVAVSRHFGETTATRVPGQRVASPTELYWGSEYPLASFLLKAAQVGQLHMATPAEQIRITRRGTQVWARLRASRAYSRVSRLRRALIERGDERGRALYDAELDLLGFDVERVSTLGGAGLFTLDLPDIMRQLWSTESGSLGALALVSGLACAGWMLWGMVQKRDIQAHRAAIPLTIGGWGSRGKSGTERLKASLFHGLGYRVVAKTTGCEAMVIVSIPGGEPTEIFLFRPYDKVTIWEQTNVLKLAADIGSQVMLWECMALQPEYVEILQGGWMRDAFVTVTNTYPDHEDLQGPSGRDVADAISAFLPKGAVAVSTERHMAPILTQRARDVGAELIAVRPEDWALLPSDLLARFPYNEHPRNIALVAKLAEVLGVPRDVALKEMADHVVPDVGVLKEYGPVAVQGRELSFINGMSANERAGFLSNWERMGLAAAGTDAGLQHRTIVLINNRADRLARQAAFVDIALRDVTADALVVVGTNVGAFCKAYRAGLKNVVVPRLLEEIDRGDPSSGRREFLTAVQLRLRRRPLGPEEAETLLRSMLPDASEQRARQDVRQAYDAAGVQLADSPSLQTLVEQGSDGSHEDLSVMVIDQWLKETAWMHHLAAQPDAWEPQRVAQDTAAILSQRLVALRSPGLTGDDLVDTLCRLSPAGSQTRILGAQNIKGVGLSFARLWISVGKVLAWIDEIEGADAGIPADRLSRLARYTFEGRLDADIAVASLLRLEEAGRFFELGLTKEEVEVAIARVRTAAGLQARRPRQAGPGSFKQTVIGWLEAMLDFGDSVLRRRRMERLFEDLSAGRVGYDRAALEAKRVVDRQQGGWLQPGS